MKQEQQTMEIAYRVYNDGTNIVAVAFPLDGGDAKIGDTKYRKAIPLKTLELDLTGDPPVPYDMPFGTAKPKDIVNGGLEFEINYDDERVYLRLLSSLTNEPVDGKTVVYRFEDLCIKDERETPIKLAKSKSTYRFTKDQLPISDETWP